MHGQSFICVLGRSYLFCLLFEVWLIHCFIHCYVLLGDSGTRSHHKGGIDLHSQYAYKRKL